MTIKSSDVSVVLSGGSANLNPNNSLGGPPSSAPVVTNSLNNLFDDVSPEEAESGIEDYRCIYFFNDGDASVYDIELWVSDYAEGATMQLGVELANEIQRLTLSNGPITGGSLVLSYASKQFTINYDSDLGDWASDFQAKLRALIGDSGQPLLRDVVVTAQNVGPTNVLFDISFVERDGYRNHPSITAVPGGNTLTGNNGQVAITITTPQEGAPINTSAPEIDVETTPPGGVGFSSSTQQSPITLPRLDPTDGFPIWVKRQVTAQTDPVEGDGFQLRFVAQTLEPAQ